MLRLGARYNLILGGLLLWLLGMALGALDADAPGTDVVDSVVAQLRPYRDQRVAAPSRPDLDTRLIDTAEKLLYEKSAANVLPQLRRLIRAGATTSLFSDYELSGLTVADIVSNRFLMQDLRHRPDRDLFHCVSLLIAAGPAALTNRTYAGNGGITSMVLLMGFLLSWRHPLNDRVWRDPRAPFPARNVGIFYGQCRRLLLMLRAQSELYPVPEHPRPECRHCRLVDFCGFGSLPLPYPELAAHITKFLYRDWLGLGLAQMFPSLCYFDHEGMPWKMPIPFVHLRAISQCPALYGPILRVMTSSRKFASRFLDGLQGSKASRAMLLELLRDDAVADVLTENDWVAAELVRRRDRRSLQVLLRKLSAERRARLYRNECEGRVGCTERIAALLRQRSICIGVTDAADGPISS